MSIITSTKLITIPLLFWVYTMTQAYLTFENYHWFRCESRHQKLALVAIIKMVFHQGKWYLDGDLLGW